MPHLIVKDNGLCILNDGYVTDYDDAPCICGGVRFVSPDSINATIYQEEEADPDSGSVRIRTLSINISPFSVPIAQSNPQVYVSSCDDLEIPCTGQMVFDHQGGGGVQTRTVPLVIHEIECHMALAINGDPIEDGRLKTITFAYRGIGEDSADAPGDWGESSGRFWVYFLERGDDGGIDGTSSFIGYVPNQPRALNPHEASMRVVGGSFAAHAEEHPNGGSSTGEWSPGRSYIEVGSSLCESGLMEAVRCSDGSNPITVDAATKPETGITNPLYEDEPYVLTGNAGDPVATEGYTWADVSCAGYPTMRRCDGVEGVLTYRPSEKPPGAVTGLIDDVRWVPSGQFLQLEPSVFQWSTDPCDDAGDDVVWELCGSGQFSYPVVASAPNKIRMQDFATDYAEITWSYGPYTDGNGSDCYSHFRVHYHKVEDDGGDYRRYIGTPVSGPCSSLRDRYISTVCDRNPNDPGDPTDPQNPASTNPANPDPMAAMRKYYGCDGCGDPGF